jgi:Fur family transcriptional regulator, ferric uptake regulator
MMNNALGILKNFDLRHTDTRENILNGFLSKTTALSHGDLEMLLESGFDRVTIYRTLKTFLDKGIIHKILDDNGGVKYALCKEQCSSDAHHHDHVHFKCSDCNETYCLEKFLIPEIILPEGYQRKEVNVLVQGICPKCN